MPTPYYSHSKPETPRWALGLYRLDRLKLGDEFWTPGGRRGVVLIPVDGAGKVFIAVESIEFEGPVRGELLIRPDRPAA